MSSILRSSKKLLFGIGLAGCGAAAALLLGLNDDRKVAKAASLLDNYRNDFFINGPPPASGLKWDNNWDHREPQMLVKPLLRGTFRDENDENNYNEKLEKAKSTAKRHLLLVRHGQYNLKGATDADRILTQLGRQQAQLTGLRLKELSLPYSRIVQSTMSRATETAQIISKELPDVPVSSCELLREGAPFPPEPSYSRYRVESKQYFEDGARIEAAFRRYFHRADPSQTTDSYEILVCHANVIRYFVCRALQFPPEAWLRFSLHNCSVTWITMLPRGGVVVYTVGDTGHIPPDKMTTT
ncbi:serine/threonine-protein phosphatase Pgam5: mitochondrial-like protein [Dinothrombium tinctorium]|uniref:Serine/threonine-protein phosphatase PGAM5, mitochondrial n=1 Tax=Dinothrombium tinctorium TaxID=1965070 RepID=A0A3S3NQB9_9ACAR|nr:serine/threonine-protein phosphatase Pgam5: mitochondrial-like protein [Dinothrombium tinctorium]RWS07911.1 serine/threonine-protein phosphatase Pgam5: mitochondrial-like protein [Dinothrombium tinctorium]RWS07914.1 serine/threonine-protein phosphatase Pgam5: mitochondrial-like protein [Dinothrombium tinctorium]RWS08181.1 serine/threonine-protein phosphatase Pgam5: mitochondrial-like protein [Dinothrombium tinctorium]